MVFRQGQVRFYLKYLPGIAAQNNRATAGRPLYYEIEMSYHGSSR
jgi:hypothetical protein